MPYLLIAIFGILLLRNGDKVKMHSKSFILLAIYMIIEFLNGFRAVNPNMARGLILNSFCLLVIAAGLLLM